MPPLADVARYLDDLLRTHEIPDYPPAHNGLQLENRRGVSRVAAAVDFSRRAVEAAVHAGADLLLVHHGMFWGGTHPLRGQPYERLRLLLAHDVAVYASHLPLDAHPELGNNALLARELGLEPTAGFARYQTIEIGVRGESDVATAELARRAGAFAARYGHAVVAPPWLPADRRTRRWAICTGAGASGETIREALAAGVDTLIVGEGPQHTAVEAGDQGLAIIYAGHYATETLGVQALARQLEQTFGLPWSFVDVPTGL